MKPWYFVRTGSIVEMGGDSRRNFLHAKKNTSQNSKIVNRGGSFMHKKAKQFHWLFTPVQFNPVHALNMLGATPCQLTSVYVK